MDKYKRVTFIQFYDILRFYLCRNKYFIMEKFAYSFPIMETKIDEWLEFVKEINTTRRKAFSKMHLRIGVQKESWYLQELKNGYEVVVYTEAIDSSFMERFKNDDSDFSNWFRKSVSEFQSVNLDSKTKLPKIVLNWKENESL